LASSPLVLSVALLSVVEALDFLSSVFFSVAFALGFFSFF